MKKILVVFLVILIFALGLFFYYVSQQVSYSAPIIWFSPSGTISEWKETKVSDSWWGEYLGVNSKKVVVYLSPVLEVSSVSVEKDGAPVYYVNWREFLGLPVMSISVNWDVWKTIDKNQRDNRLSGFIAQEIARKIKVGEDRKSKFAWDAITAEVSPIEINLR